MIYYQCRGFFTDRPTVWDDSHPRCAELLSYGDETFVAVDDSDEATFDAATRELPLDARASLWRWWLKHRR